jgi:hypothetical protein
VVTTPIAHTGLPLTVIETATATATETGTGTGTGTGTVIVIEGWIHLVAADDTTNPPHTTTADTPPPHVAILEVQTDTDPVATVMAHANGNAPRDTKMMITAKDLPLIDTDRPVGATAMTMTKIQKSVGDVDARGGNVKRIGIAIGGDTTICQRNR